MWKGYYGKEPFNLRLTVLRLLYKLPVIAAVTVLGALAFGGGYYVKNVLLRGQRFYAATSFYRVEYAVDNVEDMMKVFINEMSWNTYMQSQMFLDAVQGHLEQGGTVRISDEELAGTIQAYVLSDLRVPSTVITSDSPEKTMEIAGAVEAAMVQELAEHISEIASVEVIDPAAAAQEVQPDVRTGRAFALSAILSCFFTLVVLLLKETGDDSIWLPGSVWKRYGLKVAGTIESRELAENMAYLFGKGRACGKEPGEEPSASSGEHPAGEGTLEDVAVCPVQPGLDSRKVLERLREACPDILGESWKAVASPIEEPKVCRQLREAGGILLVLRAGSHAGRALERVLEYLAQQDCTVTAVLLWDADEKLIRRYDFLGS